MSLHIIDVSLEGLFRTTETSVGSEDCEMGSVSEALPVDWSPKTSVNLAGLKEAFSNHQAPGIGSKQSSHKAACAGPSQKKMFSFVSCSKKITDIMRPALKCSPSFTDVSSNKSTTFLAKFKSTFDGDADDSGAANQSSAEDHKEILHNSENKSVLHPIIHETDVKAETIDESVDHEPSVPETKSEQHQDRIYSPEAKRARCEDDPPVWSCLIDSKNKNASLQLDSPVRIQKKTVLLQFSMQELSERMQRLQAQSTENNDRELKYRRFRAKINPGENHSAEDELKKEIRLD